MFALANPFYTDWWDNSPTELYDQGFGMPTMLDRNRWRNRDLRRPYWMQPTRTTGSCDESGVSRITNDKERFMVNLDVKHFTPDEVKVRLMNDTLEIEGKHDEKLYEHGAISRHFIRRYKLPRDVDLEKVESNLTRDGTLTIEVRKKGFMEDTRERCIPIRMGERERLPVEDIKKPLHPRAA